MKNTQLEVLQSALEGLKRGLDVTLVTVIKTYGTSPRPVGSLLVVCSDGSFCGSVSGGCIEDDLLERLTSSPPVQFEISTYGETEKERHHFGLPCGGTLEVLLEPLKGQSQQLQELVSALESRQTVARTVNIGKAIEGSTPQVSIRAWEPQDRPEFRNGIWKNVLGPVWRLLIIGAGQTSAYLAEMATALGYRIFVCDPRPQYRQNWSVKDTSFVDGYPDDAVRSLQPDERTAIVALTHDPKLDDLALLEALKSPAFYVGALGSFNTNQNRRRRLQQHFDFSNAEVSALRGPVGLPIGSKTPPEIAVAILAELTGLRHGIDLNASLAKTVETA
ncbi:XdhC family protein [Aestuariicella sp. G3-2]|uniref:XdhC family protein n=1 Tax=Pseudomaricurvus albidus TaxID=2842452 RepID=UPI001C0B324A|nr:XdhC family protein [Aestuariicella albida]